MVSLQSLVCNPEFGNINIPIFMVEFIEEFSGFSNGCLLQAYFPCLLLQFFLHAIDHLGLKKIHEIGTDIDRSRHGEECNEHVDKCVEDVVGY